MQRRSGFTMLGVIAVVIVVGGYIMFPGMYHRAVNTAINTVFDALHASFGGEKQRPFGGKGLDRPPRVPGEGENAAPAKPKAKPATRTTTRAAKVNSEN